jgi:ParB/RepB/Spo0J family partition protein
METRIREKRQRETSKIPFELIVNDETPNQRVEYGDIVGLSKSIEHSGLMNPIKVQRTDDGRFIVRNGFRRMRAIRMLVDQGVDFPFVEAFLVPKGYKEEDALLEQILSNDGLPYSQLEEGIVYSLLIGRGYKDVQLAEKTGKKVSHIRTCICLSKLPMRIQNKISEGVLSGNTAIEIYKSVNGNEEKAVKVIEDTLAKKADSPDGEKKVRPRDVETIKTRSVIKRLQELCTAFSESNLSNERTELISKLTNRLKAGSEVEELLELFK